jgi:hypothetical protein
MKTQKLTSLFRIVLAVAGTVTAMDLSVTPAKGAAALWISAPTWSYSAALASSPIGTAYFWGFSVGAGTFSWAGAYSNDGLGDAAYAFAEAAPGRGGLGAFLWTGVADPWSMDAVDISPIDPSNPNNYPSSAPSSNPFATSPSYTISGTGITFNESGEELNGDEELEAFVYNGSTSESGLESELGASSSGGTTSSGDVTDLGTLESDLGLMPLDAPIEDPSSSSSLTFTEDAQFIDPNDDNVILVGISDAPEPGTLSLLAVGMAAAGLVFKKRNRA